MLPGLNIWLQVVYLSDVHIRVTLLDKPKITGDVAQVRTQPELDAAADALASAVRGNSLVIQDKGPGGQVCKRKKEWRKGRMWEGKKENTNRSS